MAVLYPVAANLAPAVREEFQTWLNQTNDAMVVCDLADDETPSNVAMLGVIDGKQLVALRGVVSLGETDVASLAQHVGEDVAPTAWNNDLVRLVAKGLVHGTRQWRKEQALPPDFGRTQLWDLILAPHCKVVDKGLGPWEGRPLESESVFAAA